MTAQKQRSPSFASVISVLAIVLYCAGFLRIEMELNEHQERLNALENVAEKKPPTNEPDHQKATKNFPGKFVLSTENSWELNRAIIKQLMKTTPCVDFIRPILHSIAINTADDWSEALLEWSHCTHWSSVGLYIQHSWPTVIQRSSTASRKRTDLELLIKLKVFVECSPLMNWSRRGKHKQYLRRNKQIKGSSRISFTNSKA